jgi:hypothetical protein
MKAEELRIGNLVYITDETYSMFYKQETEINIHNLMYLSGETKEPIEFSLEPIPLTEEWLVKFGFNILLTEKESILYRKNSQDVNVHPIGGFTYGVRGVPVVKIKNVHQLQNLYFALTGEELAIPI